MDLFEEYIYKFISLSEQDAVISNNKRFIRYRTKINHIKKNIGKDLQDHENRDSILNLIDDMSSLYLEMSTHFRYLDFKTAFLAGIVVGLKTNELDSEEILKNANQILEEEINERNRRNTKEDI